MNAFWELLLPSPMCCVIVALYTLHSTLHTLYSTLYTLNSTLYTPHSTLYTPHSTLHTLHTTLDFTLYTPRSTLYTPHSTLYTLHSTLCTPPSSAFHSLQCTGTVTGEKCTVQITCFTKVFYVTAFGFVGCILFFGAQLLMLRHAVSQATSCRRATCHWLNI